MADDVNVKLSIFRFILLRLRSERDRKVTSKDSYGENCNSQPLFSTLLLNNIENNDSNNNNNNDNKHYRYYSWIRDNENCNTKGSIADEAADINNDNYTNDDNHDNNNNNNEEACKCLWNNYLISMKDILMRCNLRLEKHFSQVLYAFYYNLSTIDMCASF